MLFLISGFQCRDFWKKCKTMSRGASLQVLEWQAFLKTHNLEASMSRRGNCYDNAVAESFFHLLKSERIRRKTYATREEARQDVFNYIELFYNPKRKHGKNGMLSPIDFERQKYVKLQGVLENQGRITFTPPLTRKIKPLKIV